MFVSRPSYLLAHVVEVQPLRPSVCVFAAGSREEARTVNTRKQTQATVILKNLAGWDFMNYYLRASHLAYLFTILNNEKLSWKYYVRPKSPSWTVQVLGAACLQFFKDKFNRFKTSSLVHFSRLEGHSAAAHTTIYSCKKCPQKNKRKKKQTKNLTHLSKKMERLHMKNWHSKTDLQRRIHCMLLQGYSCGIYDLIPDTWCNLWFTWRGLKLVVHLQDLLLIN